MTKRKTKRVAKKAPKRKPARRRLPRRVAVKDPIGPFLARLGACANGRSEQAELAHLSPEEQWAAASNQAHLCWYLEAIQLPRRFFRRASIAVARLALKYFAGTELALARATLDICLARATLDICDELSPGDDSPRPAYLTKALYSLKDEVINSPARLCALHAIMSASGPQPDLEETATYVRNAAASNAAARAVPHEEGDVSAAVCSAIRSAIPYEEVKRAREAFGR